MAPKGRPGCTLDVDELREVFEQHGLQQLKAGSFQAVNVCTVHSEHAALFKTLLGLTRVLNSKLVAQALPTNKLTSEQKQIVSKSMCHAFSDLLTKQRNFQRHGYVPRPAGIYDVIFAGCKRDSRYLYDDEEASDAEAVEADSRAEAPRNLLQRHCSISDAEEPVNLLELGGSSAPSTAQSLLGEPLQSLEIQSSQEVVDYHLLPHWWDGREEKMAVQVPGCSLPTYGSVATGHAGFLIVTWPDGTKQNTEVSNLALAVAAETKNKASHTFLKRPAAAPKKAAVRAPGLDGETLSEHEPEVPSSSAEGPRKKAKPTRQGQGALPEVAAVLAVAVPLTRVAAPSAPLPRDADKHPVLRQESPVFGPCKTYRGPDKSYIQYYDPEGKRWVSVVNFTGQQVRFRHNECLMNVWGKLREPGFGTEEVAVLKKFLLAHPAGADVN